MKRALIIATLFAVACVRDGIEERAQPPSVQQPRVVLRNPQAHATFPWNAEIRVAADVHDIGNATVEFGAEDTTIARDSASPYETAFRPRRHGPIVITAQVRDAGGNVIAGDAITVTVVNPNPVSSTQELSSRNIAMAMSGPEPLAILKQPTNGQKVRAEAGVRFVVEAAGLEAPLAGVEFVADGMVVRQVAVSGDAVTGEIYPKPIEYLWPNPSPGRHVVMVRAIDSEGRIGMSKTATVTVETVSSTAK